MGSKIILIYGQVSHKFHGKQQRMIDGVVTCGYREYAKCGNIIIYPRPQNNLNNEWEFSMPQGKGLVDFCNSRPDHVVWSIKKDPNKDLLLKKIKNRKLYYSCCSANTYNKACDVSLVDTESRIKNPRCKLFFKGKDPDFWKPVTKNKKFDYLIIGRRADKNEIYFLNSLHDQVHEIRNVLWIGGAEHAKKVKNNRHNIEFTPVLGQESVRNRISEAKVGILFTEHKLEGFPQSLLEMTMCGVPVVYSDVGPINKFYVFENNILISTKKRLVMSAEKLLQTYNPEKCRQQAVENYSIQKSIDYLTLL